MPRNGSGTYQLPAGNPVVTGTIISSTTQNTTMSDVATALTNSIAKDGQTVPTANLPMGGFKHTGAADATATGQYLTYGQNGTVLGNTTIDGTLTMNASTMIWAKGADVASASTLPLVADGNYFDVTGTTAITAFASLGVGSWIGLHFDDALILTHNATDLILPGGANITTAAGDEAIFVEYASGDWRCVSYTRADGSPLSGNNTQIQPITASVGSNALTITLNPTTLDFRDATLGSGTVNTRTVSAAISVVVSSGSTLGTINAVQNRLAVLAIDNAGTVELAVVNLAGGVNLDETGVISTTAEGGAGGADSAAVIYSTTARTNVPYRVVGFVESTQATAGTWATAPSKIQGYGGQAFAAMSSLGYGQTWQNLLGSRAVATTYYNTTGKPIWVIAAAANATSSFSISLIVNGRTISSYSGTTVGASYSVTGLVPVGGSYSITTVNMAALGLWEELR